MKDEQSSEEDSVEQLPLSKKVKLISQDKINDSCSTSSTSSLFRSSRVVETGEIKIKAKLHFAIWFETCPYWILALQPLFIDSICFPQHTSFSSISAHLTAHDIDQSIYNTMINFIGRQLFSFSKPNTNVWHLVSGSLSFWNDISLEIDQQQVIYVTDIHKKWRILPST